MLEIRIAYALLLVGLIAFLLLVLRINPFVVENLPGTERRFSRARTVVVLGLLLGYLLAPVPHELWVMVTRPLYVLVGAAAAAWWVVHRRGNLV